MDHYVKAGIVDHRFEADRVAQALQEAEIPFMIKSFLDTAYDGLFIPQKGWAAVMVPDGFLERTEKIIAELRQSFKEEGGDETQ